MQKSRKSAVVTMQYPARVEISQPELELSPSLAHLDVARLAKAASAELEVGFVNSGCCRQALRASIRKGKVTALYAESCRDGKPASPELAKLIHAARRRVMGPKAQPKWQPVPVADFLENVALLSVDAWVCIKFCLFGHCFMCCAHATSRSFCIPAVAVASEASA
jgi:hypothetical protein